MLNHAERRDKALKTGRVYFEKKNDWSESKKETKLVGKK